MKLPITSTAGSELAEETRCDEMPENSGAMATTSNSLSLRTHRAADIGWIVQRHGDLYFAEYGWNAEFEALVAEIGSAFLRHYDPDWERCWIAELSGERVGSVR